MTTPESASIDPDANPKDQNTSKRAFTDLPPKTQLTINSVSLLDNVSTQLLRLLATNPPETVLEIAFPAEQDSPINQEIETFQTLLVLFKQVKKIYNTESPLLTVHDVAPVSYTHLDVYKRQERYESFVCAMNYGVCEIKKW